MGETTEEPMSRSTLKEYESLLEDQKMLNALDGAGVDNWQGYDDAMELLEDD